MSATGKHVTNERARRQTQAAGALCSTMGCRQMGTHYDTAKRRWQCQTCRDRLYQAKVRRQM